MKQYELTLKNNKSLGLDVLSWFIVTYNLLLFLGVATWVDRLGFVGVGVIVVTFMVMRFLKKRSFDTNLVLLLSPVIPWLILGSFLYAMASLILAGLFFLANRPKIVLFDDRGISYPSFPSKAYEWEKINHSMLKDGMLTIDLKSNKLIQQLIENGAKQIDEKEFNEFCSGRINRSN